MGEPKFLLGFQELWEAMEEQICLDVFWRLESSRHLVVVYFVTECDGEQSAFIFSNCICEPWRDNYIKNPRDAINERQPTHEQSHSSDISVESYCFCINKCNWIHRALFGIIIALQQSGAERGGWTDISSVYSSELVQLYPQYPFLAMIYPPVCTGRNKTRDRHQLEWTIIINSTKVRTRRWGSRGIAPLKT
jgi:hypothetical protein